MPAVVLLLIALGMVVAESVLLSVFSVQIWAVQTPLILAIYLGLDRDFVTGGLILTAMFVPVELLIGGVPGVYSLGLAVVFLMLQISRSSLQRGWGIARGITAVLAALVHGFVMLLALFMIGEGGSRLTASVGWQMWAAAPVVGLATVLVGKAFARVDVMMDPRGGDTGLN